MPSMTTAEAIRTILDGRWAEVRQEVRSTLDPEVFGPPEELLSMEQHRERTLQAVLELTKTDFGRNGFTTEQGGTNEHGAAVTAIEMLGHADLSVFVKAGVQFGLFGGAIANLGTQRHWDAYLPGMLDGTLLGSFAMTETGHGSDVQSLLTTATYLPESDEIEIHTPSIAARKDYIGNAARDSTPESSLRRLEAILACRDALAARSVVPLVNSSVFIDGKRTTVDLPGGLHRTLKVLACEHDTTVQALILAAVLRSQ